jgi:hypothetical protein
MPSPAKLSPLFSEEELRKSNLHKQATQSVFSQAELIKHQNRIKGIITSNSPSKLRSKPKSMLSGIRRSLKSLTQFVKKGGKKSRKNTKNCGGRRKTSKN